MSATALRRLTITALSSLLATVLLAAFSALPSTSLASSPAQVGPQPMTLPAGGTASIKVRGFCLAFGKPFPTGSTSLNGLATDNVRQALYYALQKGYTDSDATQVQEAIWFLQDKTWHNADHIIGQEIVDNAASVSAIPTGSGTAITEPTLQNVLTMTATFIPQTPDAFYGDADLVIKNTGTTELQFYVPIGAKFTVPGSNGQFQDLLVYALQPAGGTPTVAAATEVATVAATSTTAPIATAVVETPTSMPVATATTEANAPLPTTGVADDTASASLLFILAFACALLGFGLFMRFRPGIKK
ncbi:MAG: hypothetical protein ABIQ44_05685 [Chloroflexia bacterium]